MPIRYSSNHFPRWTMKSILLKLALIVATLSVVAAVTPGASASEPSNPNAASAPKASFDIWQTEDGLPQNSITAILQTRDGYLWLGTQDGLVRFDGVKFTTFNKRNTPGIRGNNVACLFE